MTESKRATIYVAEDDSINRMLLEAILESYNVRSFPNGYDALMAIREEPTVPDLLITDRNMPIMNGEELIREARRFWATRDPNRIVPVIMLTGGEPGYDPNSKEFRERIIDIGANDVLIKPVTPSVLLTAVLVQIS